MLAAAVAYYVAVSFFPLLLILLSVLGMLLGTTDMGASARKELLDAIASQASPVLSEQVEAALGTISNQASSGGPIGFVTLLITAGALFVALDSAFDRIWNVPEKASGGWLQTIWSLVRVRLKAFLMLLCVGAFVLTVFIASLVYSAANEWVPARIGSSPFVRWLMQSALGLALNSVAFTAIYRFLPKVEVAWRPAWCGGLLAALAWEVGRQALAGYLFGRDYPTAYGVVGSFLAIMLWSYYAVCVLFLGAELTQAISRHWRRDADDGATSR